MKRSRVSGVSLLEVMIATTMLGLAVLASTLFFRQSTRNARRTFDSSALTRTLAVLEKDLMKDMAFIPPQDNDDPAENSAMYGAEPAPPPIPPPANPPAVPYGERCYDRNGSLLDTCAGFTTNNAVVFLVRYFKSRVRDQSLNAASPLNRIPISRIRMKVYYKLENRVQTPLFFSRLLTEVIRY